MQVRFSLPPEEAVEVTRAWQERLAHLRAYRDAIENGDGFDSDYYWDNPDQGVHQFDGGLGDGSFL